MKALIARKIGMTSAIGEDGALQAVTMLSVEPNIVTQIKTDGIDGYNAAQLGTGVAKLGKALAGHFKKSKIMPKIIREFRINETEEDLKVGSKIDSEVFSVGDIVCVTGTSKGKGFAGTIKRHNFHRQRKTHGGKGNTRKVGSIGSMYPQKIFKGKKMSGQMGGEQTTIRNLKVVAVDGDSKTIALSGAVPGPRKGIILIRGNK